MGVLGGPLGHLWESLRVPWGHLGSACGALAVLKIIEKPLVFIVFSVIGRTGRARGGLLRALEGALAGAWGASAVSWESLGCVRKRMGSLGGHKGMYRARMESVW